MTRMTRRQWIKLAGSAAGLSVLPGVLRAAQYLLTPPQTEGPFYPERIPLDSDNDLVQVAGRTAMAGGTISNVVGRVLDERGRAVRGALVEIWQCDANGRYHHRGDDRDAPLDENFQGFGSFTTGADGAYRFRTIKPVHYPGRTPHIHFKIKGPDFEALTTQMYVRGEPGNERDFLFKRIRDERARESLLVAFEPDPEDSAELLAHFDIVIVADGRFG